MKALAALLFLSVLLYFSIGKQSTSISTPATNEEKLESFYKNKVVYDEAFQKAEAEIKAKEKVFAGVVSHHFLAKDLIAKFFTGISNENIKNVYIVGPDHFSTLLFEDFGIATSNLDWETVYGEMEASKQVVGEVKDTTFKNEHSVYTLVPFAKKIFPNAKITPLVLKTSLDYQKFYDYGKKAYRDDSILIISADFSHNATQKLANKNDLESIKFLTSKNMAEIDKIETDCKQCIAFMLGYLSNIPSGFKLIENKTSEDFGSTENQNLTSYISAYYVMDDYIRILFGGDLMFDRYIRQIGNSKGYEFILEKLTGYLQDKDLVVANLEGPITDYKSVSIGSEVGSKNNFIFTFDKQVIDTLLKNNLKVFNIGNNHILNFSNKGLEETEKFLSDAQIEYFGDTGIKQPKVLIKQIKGKNFAFVNYNQFTGNEDALDKTTNIIKKARENNDFVIVYNHWGDEYSKIIPKHQQETAHRIIDAGADVIIGSHPHIIQETEIYKGKHIYYSLGNFVFDQYFSEDTQKGLLVEMIVDIENNKISFIDKVIELKSDGQTVFKQ